MIWGEAYHKQGIEPAGHTAVTLRRKRETQIDYWYPPSSTSPYAISECNMWNDELISISYSSSSIGRDGMLNDWRNVLRRMTGNNITREER